MNRKLFVFDMDGTLITSKNEILPKTIKALKKAREQGHALAIATGRPLSFIKKHVNIKLFDYLICSNGAYYYEQKSDKIYSRNFIPQKIIEEIIKIAQTNNLPLFLSNVGDTICAMNKENEELKNAIISLWGSIKIINYNNAFKILEKNQIVQLSIWSSDDKKIKDLKKYFIENNDKIEIRVANQRFLDTSPKNVSKYAAIKKILPTLQISKENVIAFGDSDNDIEMLNGASLGIAMGNATQAAKEVATEIIGDHLTPAIANKILQIIKE